METLRMDYRFTALLIVMFIILTVFAKPAYPRNEYLNEYGARCGDFETRVEAEDRNGCLLYTSPSPRDLSTSRMPSSA